MGKSKGSEIEVTVLTENRYDEWETFVRESPQGSVYSLPSYLEVLCSAAGGSYQIVSVFRNGQLAGGCALYESKRYGQPVIQNRLLLYYNGVVLGSHQTKYPSEKTSRDLEILSALEKALSQLPHARVLLHNRATLTDVRPFLSAQWKVWPSYTYVVPLTDLPSQWQLVEKNLRRLIDRCGEQGVTCTDDSDFESFFALHLQIHQRKNAPLYLPKKEFGTYVTALEHKGLCRLFHARLSSGQSIASQLVLLGHPTTHTVCAGADSEYLKMGATPFLRWRACEALSAAGFVANDLTDAALNSVTHFKSQFGGELQSTWILSRGDSAGLKICDALYHGVHRGRAICGKLIRSVITVDEGEG